MAGEQKRIFFTLLAAVALLGVVGAASSLICPACHDLLGNLLFIALLVAIGGAVIITTPRVGRAERTPIRMVAIFLLASATWHLLRMVIAILEELGQGLQRGLATVFIVRLLGSLLLFVVFLWLATRNRSGAETGV